MCVASASEILLICKRICRCIGALSELFGKTENRISVVEWCESVANLTTVNTVLRNTREKCMQLYSIRCVPFTQQQMMFIYFHGIIETYLERHTCASNVL